MILVNAAELNEAKQAWEQIVPFKDYYTVQDVCTILNVGGPSVYGAIKRGTLRGVRVNGVAHVRHDALIQYIARRGQATTFDPSQLVIEDIVPEKEAVRPPPLWPASPAVSWKRSSTSWASNPTCTLAGAKDW